MDRNQLTLANGTVGQCFWPNSAHRPCTFVQSTGSHECDGVGCAGVYQVIGFEVLGLPPGWVWVSYDHVHCTLISNPDSTLYCGYGSSDVIISPTVP